MARIFIGLRLSDKLNDLIYEWQLKWHNLPVRFTPRQNLHLTLIPPWEADSDSVITLKKKLLEIKGNVDRFEMAFPEIAYGPDRNCPRLIWLRGEVTPQLTALKKQIEERLAVITNDRNFLPHITLARFRPEQIFDFPPAEIIEQSVDWSDTLFEVAMFESKIEPDVGVEYEVLEDIII